MKTIKIIFFISLFFSLSSCDEILPKQESNNSSEQLLNQKMQEIKPLDNAKDTSLFNPANQENEDQKWKKIGKEAKQKYDIAFINESYYCFFNRIPTQNELVNWLNVLNQEGSREGIIRNLTSDEEYLRKIEKNILPDKSKLAHLTFLLDLVNLKGPSELNSISIHLMQRELLDKIFDYLSVAKSSPEVLAQWYAKLSLYFAKEFKNNGSFANSIRKNKEASFQKSWANQAPFEMLKSEAALKTCWLLRP